MFIHIAVLLALQAFIYNIIGRRCEEADCEFNHYSYIYILLR